jgi:NAD-dependent dihydropyrimidine dehydrogenase PreA subunit
MKKNRDRIEDLVHVNMNSCDGCGVCAEVCPNDVFEMILLSDDDIKELSFFGKLKVRIRGNTKSYAANPGNCTTCGECVSNCHERAISVKGVSRRA